MTESSSSSEESASEDDFDPSEGEEEEEEVEEAEESEVDSEDLDGEQDVKVKKVKRKSTGGRQSVPKKVAKKEAGSHAHIDGYDDEDDALSEDDSELEDGQEVSMRIYPAPKTGQGRFVPYSGR